MTLSLGQTFAGIVISPIFGWEMDGPGVVKACSEMRGTVLGGEWFGKSNAGLGSSPRVDRGRRARGRSHRARNRCDGLETFEERLCLDVLFFAGLFGLHFAKGFQDHKVFGEFGKCMRAVGNSGSKVLENVELNCDRPSWLEVWHFRRGARRGVIFTGRVFLAAFAVPFRRRRSICVKYDGNLFRGGFARVDRVHEFLELDDFVFVALTSSFGVVEVRVVFVASQVASGLVVVAGDGFKLVELHGADSGKDEVFLLSLQQFVAKEGEVSDGRWRRH